VGNDDVTWRFVRSSRIGTGHLAQGLPCQDANLARLLGDPGSNDVLTLLVSDGAGSASHSHVGSRLICEVIFAEIERAVRDGQDLSAAGRLDVERWLHKAVDALIAHAECHDLTARDLAATSLGCVVAPTATICFQLGDGAIVIDDAALEFAPVFWPQRGEYANMTVFLTEEDAIGMAEVLVLPRRVERVALFSDGIQMLALHYATKTAYAPFFSSLFATLERQPSGESDALNWALDDLLDRKQITDRTDDDRTLVLASRRTE
jgi:hypothetical protein